MTSAPPDNGGRLLLGLVVECRMRPPSVHQQQPQSRSSAQLIDCGGSRSSRRRAFVTTPRATTTPLHLASRRHKHTIELGPVCWRSLSADGPATWCRNTSARSRRSILGASRPAMSKRTVRLAAEGQGTRAARRPSWRPAGRLVVCRAPSSSHWRQRREMTAGASLNRDANVDGTHPTATQTPTGRPTERIASHCHRMASAPPHLHQVQCNPPARQPLAGRPSDGVARVAVVCRPAVLFN
jgi:hypothetical protein